MTTWTHRLVMTAALALVACGGVMGGADAGTSADAGSAVDAGSQDAGLTDAGSTALAMYPAWQLTDIQPVSPRFNEVYGLSAFAGRPLVVILLQGY